MDLEKQLEERIIELETRLSFQDRLLQELNDVIAGQQKQMDALEKDMRCIREHLKTITPEDVTRPEEDVPPPHY